MQSQQPPTAPQPGAWQAPMEEAGPAPGVRFAPHGPRLMAYIVDAVIVFVAIVALSIAFAILVAIAASSDSAGGTGAAIGGGLLYVALILLVSVAYFPYFWKRDGATPGMKMFRLRVVRDADGGPITTGQAILRVIGFWIDGLVFYLGYVWILIDKRRRGWHDLIAGTVVIELP